MANVQRQKKQKLTDFFACMAATRADRFPPGQMTW